MSDITCMIFKVQDDSYLCVGIGEKIIFTVELTTSRIDNPYPVGPYLCYITISDCPAFSHAVYSMALMSSSVICLQYRPASKKRVSKKIRLKLLKH